MDEQLQGLGVVVIGRNEGQRLVVSLKSVTGHGIPVVYVDSGSTDGSQDNALALGADVVALDMAIPFTAARARNAGFARLKELVGGRLTAVQFIDGDCEVREGWLAAGLHALSANPKVAAVAGRCRERYPEKTIYNRLCDMEWARPAGLTEALGGNAMYRCSAFETEEGFNPRFIAGEEPEFCFRLRARGWRILRLDDEMVWHDAAITSFSQYTKRLERSGWAFAEGAATHGQSPERYNVRQRDGIFRWGVLMPLGALTAAIAGIVLPHLLGWILLGVALVGVPMLYLLLALKTALWTKQQGHSWQDALAYGFFLTIGKFPQTLGALRYLRSKARGEEAKIIEYKSAG